VLASLKRRPGRRASWLQLAKASVFSTTFRYALIGLLELAQSQRYLQTSVIAQEFSLSPHFLSAVLRELRRLGFVESQRGNRGGFRLNCPPEQINLLDLHLSLAGSGSDARGIDAEANGSSMAERWLQSVSQRWSSELANTTLADLLGEPGPGSGRTSTNLASI